MVGTRKIPGSAPPSLDQGAASARYDDLERRRTALRQRLARIEARVSAHPGYKSARRLLDQRFRRSSLTQRSAILDAAAWLINVLEALIPMV